MGAMPTFAFSVTRVRRDLRPAVVSALKSVVFPALRQADDPDLQRHYDP